MSALCALLSNIGSHSLRLLFCSIGGTYLCYRHTGSDLLPAMDEGGFIVDYTMPPGSSLRETNRVISHVESILRETPDVASTARRTGLQLGLAAVTEANQGDISVKLKPMASFWSRVFHSASSNERTRPGDEVISDVRAKITEAEPALDVEFPQLLQDMIGDLTSAPQPVVIKLFSEDGDLLRHWAPVEASTIKKMPGVVDVEDGIENTTSGTAFTFTIDPAIAARAGFTPQEVELDASAMLQGEPATPPVVVNARSYTIRVQFPPSARKTLDSMRQTVIVSGTGKTASIGSLATLTEIPGQTEIIRENLQRSVDVTARLEGINLGDGMAADSEGSGCLEFACRAFEWNTAASSPNSKNPSVTWSSCSRWRSFWCSWFSCSNSAISVRRLLCCRRLCCPPAACFLPFLSPGLLSIFRRSWDSSW